MGRGGRGRKRPREGQAKDKEEGEAAASSKKKTWSSYDLTSDDNTFVKYYGPEGLNLLKLVGRDEGEWPQLLAAMRSNLPSTFRVSPCGNFAKRTLRSLQLYVSNIERNVQFPLIDPETNEVIAAGPPKPIGNWCPGAWTSGTFRTGLRKSDHFRNFHKYLVRATETGAVSRQELVSMIPALLLDVAPGEWVLDMCAAPGSKSLQILEALDQDKTRGVLVANDVDSRRAYLLTRRTKNVKNASLVIVTHDASLFPTYRTESGSPVFDKILCDVPCSGDGTMRKNMDLWRSLKVRDGPLLHPVQLRIAIRAVQCLKIGGTLVYSTCSLNPIEDEAIVCELLKTFPGELELVETKDLLPGLKRAQGMTQPWKFPVQRPGLDDDAIRYFNTFEEFTAWNNSLEKPVPLNHVRPSMFPPSNLSEFPLDRCMRLLPHDQDSGGFFVAVFRKVKDGYAERRKEKLADGTAAAVAGDEKTEKKSHGNKNDVWYEEISQEAFDQIKNEWGLVGVERRSFRVRMDNHTTHGKQSSASSGAANSNKFPSKIAYLNDDVLRLFEMAEQKPSSLHVVHAGVSALAKGRANAYRIVNDYAEMFLPRITKRVIKISLKQHMTKIYDNLVEKKFIADHFEAQGEEEEGKEMDEEDDGDDEEDVNHESSKKAKPSPLANKPEGAFDVDIPVTALDRETQEYLKSLNDGGLILTLQDEDQKRFGDEIGGTFALAGWWGSRTTIRFMVEKNELLELISQLKEASLI